MCTVPSPIRVSLFERNEVCGNADDDVDSVGPKNTSILFKISALTW